MTAEPLESEPTHDPEIGSIVAERYRILGVAGRGGMGVVYKAEQIHMAKTVALKMLLRDMSPNGQALKRFQHEAKCASLLRHPHIVAIHDFGVIGNNQAYLAMEYLDGISLSDALHSQGALSLERFKHIFVQACDALEHAHQNKVVHRDIKSSNLVLMEREGDKDFLVIVDFGLVKLMSGSDDQKLTKTDSIVGSPLYMSPEQCRGMDIDHRSDIYSLACVMYESLVGRLPFVGDTALDTLYKHVAEKPAPMREANPALLVPLTIERMIMKALSKNPNDRQQTMGQLGEELAAAIEAPVDVQRVFSQPRLIPSPAVVPVGETTVVSSTKITGPLKKRKSRNSPWIGTIFLLVLFSAIIIGSLVLIILRQNQTIEAELKPHRKPIDTTPVGTETASAPDPVPQAVLPATTTDGLVPKRTASSSNASKVAHPSPKEQMENEQLLALEEQAQGAFEAENWQMARIDYEKCLKIKQKLLGATNAALLPVVARLAVCADKQKDINATVDYMNQFGDLYAIRPDLISQDNKLMGELAAVSFHVSNLPMSEQLLRAAIKSRRSLVPNSDASSLGLQLSLGRVLMQEGKTADAETILRNVVEDSPANIRIHRAASKLLAELLRQSGRGSEARRFEVGRGRDTEWGRRQRN